ncbi:MAG: hypothetical protein GY771_01335 [bacterium]|nr:hypothetical protein [bacterium]
MKRSALFIIAVALFFSAGCDEDLPPYVAVWSIYQEPVIGGVSLNDVDGITRDNAWAVGDNGTMKHYDGVKWSDYSAAPTTESLYAVTMDFEGGGWAVGAVGTILYFNDGNWTAYPPVTGADLYGVAIDAFGTAWAVGDEGTVLKNDGTGWVSINHSQTTADLRGVSAVSDGLVVIVGDLGVIIEFQNGTWSSPASPVGNILNSVDSDSAGVFACGAEDVILKRTKSGWNRVTTSGNPNLNAVEVYGSDTGFVGGVHGSFYKLENGTWIPDELPEVENIALDVNGITLSDDTNGWAVGNNGLILRYGLVY